MPTSARHISTAMNTRISEIWLAQGIGDDRAKARNLPGKSESELNRLSNSSL